MAALLFLVGLALTVPPAHAQQSFSAAHAKVSLQSEQYSFVPGQTAWLGVLFEIDKGWHTYWVNPGDSGEAPKIDIQLPQGFKAGDIHWPVPARLGTGTIIDYGYEGSVLLTIPVQVPANFDANKAMTISADVRYLVCSDVCIPAKAHPFLTMPQTVKSGGDPKMFAAARAKWPAAMPASWKARAADQGDHFVLTVETGAREAQAAFYPLEANQIDNSARQTLTSSDRGVQITLKKSDLLTGAVGTLKGLLVTGNGRATEIAARVTHSK